MQTCFLKSYRFPTVLLLLLFLLFSAHYLNNPSITFQFKFMPFKKEYAMENLSFECLTLVACNLEMRKITEIAMETSKNPLTA